MFKRALLTLTLQYSLLIIGLCFLFSFGVYSYVDRSFGGDYIRGVTTKYQVENEDAKLTSAQEATDAGLDILYQGLLFANGGLLLIAPLMSYAMAKRTLDPVRKSYEAQQRFVDSASHELRIPLSIITGELELALRRPRTATEYIKVLTISLDKARSLTNLTQNLLILARGSQGTLRKTNTSISVARLIENALTQATERFPGAISTNIYNQSNATITGNTQLLTQALANIIENARKFSGEGTIIITSADEDQKVRVSIEDTGIGMSPAEVAHAFDRFYQAENSRATQGHGLGLALAREIIDAHRGQILLESHSGVGTTVTVVLPK